MSANGTSTSRLGWASAVRLHRRVAARALRASQTRPEYVRQPEIPMTMWKQGTTCGHAMPWCTYDATAGYRRRSLASSSIIYATYDAPPIRPASHRTRTTLCAAAMTTIPPSTFRYKRCGRLVLVSALSEAARPQASNAATCAHSIPVCKQLIPTRPVCARARSAYETHHLAAIVIAEQIAASCHAEACVRTLAYRPNAKRALCDEPSERL